ncbi:O-antigen ligase [Novosphingobium hassiacum]|uniref:O-antigen ligase n=1 Tax=Novosphingobium hassiacum TaxID=173676 RepID=A0A7W6EVA9_9SPHN|nr:O-antigen ligase family protein [Novosphingobium hassiacum]MBB3860087.1 O-antigen ligase [Novosphingobium hassiacum]
MLKTRANQLSALLIVAVIMGGGGVAYGLSNLVVQLFALGLLALNYSAVRDFFREGPPVLVALVVMSLCVPLLQILPLPASVWTALPGRELVAESLAAAGGPGWFAMSVDSARTFVAFIGLLAPFAVVVLGWRCPDDGLARAVLVVIGLGLLNIVLGSVQVLGGGAGILYVENEMPGVLFGFFANRNSTAIFLVCCLILMATLAPSRLLSAPGLAKFSAALLLGVGVVLTQSRTGLVLLAIPLALYAVHFASLRFRPAKPQAGGQPAGRMLLVAGVALVAIAGLATMSSGTRLDSVLARFENTEDQRPLIWDDANFTARRYWPVGAGMATFDEVFQADESLENISPRRAGRAHNDYLELAIEAGAIGLAVLAAWVLWIGVAAARAMATAQRWPALSGAGILLAIALQSVLDYPLRNQTMLCLAALAIVLLAPVRSRRSASPRSEEPA